MAGARVAGHHLEQYHQRRAEEQAPQRSPASSGIALTVKVNAAMSGDR
ncbi:MAG: hypothetical protein V4750_16635 [Pseudomonadota bacterium]